MARTRTVVAVVGCGHVGYPLSLMASVAGFEVVAVDTDQQVVDRINLGEALTEEPGIVDLAALAAESGRLRARTEPVASAIYIVAVPTPLALDGRSADLSMVVDAVESFVPMLSRGALVIIESTIPPGTCRDVIVPLLESGDLRVGADVHLAHSPERVLPGQTLDELSECERVIGGFDAASTVAARSFYETFSKGQLVETGLEAAEFVKPMENAYRDVNIALANQMAEFAESHGVDIDDVVRIANGHPRVEFLQPGIGVGGHCIPVDPWFLTARSTHQTELIDAARTVNERQPDRYAQWIVDALAPVDIPRVLLVGAAYKPEVGDIRNSPALAIRGRLEARGVEVVVYDPHADGYGGDVVELAEGADAVVVVVPHRRALQEIKDNRGLLEQVMRSPLFLETASRGVVAFPRDRDTN